MKVARLYIGADNESHFEEIELEMTLQGVDMVTALYPAQGVMFRVAPPHHRTDFHNVPRRQYVITLSGHSEIETGDGTVHGFGPGDIMLAEDLTGRGHRTRVVGGEPRHYVFIPLK